MIANAKDEKEMQEIIGEIRALQNLDAIGEEDALNLFTIAEQLRWIME